MLIVLNEMRNQDGTKHSGFQRIKSIISDEKININKKGQPHRQCDNVANLIFVSNNTVPVIIEQGDRRYVVSRVNGKYKGNYEFFAQFCNGLDTQFYEAL